MWPWCECFCDHCRLWGQVRMDKSLARVARVDRHGRLVCKTVGQRKKTEGCWQEEGSFGRRGGQGYQRWHLIHLVPRATSSPGCTPGSAAAMPLNFFSQPAKAPGVFQLEAGRQRLPAQAYTQVTVLYCHALWLARQNLHTMLRSRAGPVPSVGLREGIGGLHPTVSGWGREEGSTPATVGILGVLSQWWPALALQSHGLWGQDFCLSQGENQEKHASGCPCSCLDWPSGKLCADLMSCEYH
jgi:hypothetical protein